MYMSYILDHREKLLGGAMIVHFVSLYLTPILYMCEVGTVGKISDYQPEVPGFNPRPGRGLNFGRPSFATPSVDRDVKPLL